jgi:SAM-dependent methyltransferase
LSTKYKCPNCESRAISIFYELQNVPVHSVRLLRSREAALNYAAGDITLAFCKSCGFITNLAYEPALHDYSSGYESTQAYSPTFNTFAQGLAKRLVAQYNLYDRDIIEIGCGQGEFLNLLCELGANQGVGFDPAYINDWNGDDPNPRVVFIKDFYSEKYAEYQADFVCCKMTLEHICATADFLSTVRRSIGKRSDTIVFFQVPDVTRILNELAFWDVYYEHCSYFSPGSLARLFRKCGFEVTNLAREYGSQYLVIEANLEGNQQGAPLPLEDDLIEMSRMVTYFSHHCQSRIERCEQKLQKWEGQGQRAVIWGAGSKGVAFLTTLKIYDEIDYAVDINPNKHGTFMAGTGQEIVGPEFLKRYKPDFVIVMNPIYFGEIERTLEDLGVKAQLVSP